MESPAGLIRPIITTGQENMHFICMDVMDHRARSKAMSHELGLFELFMQSIQRLLQEHRLPYLFLWIWIP